MNPLLLGAIKAAVVVFFNLTLVAAMIYLERKILARMQHRVGPKKTGPQGLLQPMADIGKLVLKEDITPAGADRWVYTLAPIIAATLGFLGYAPIPFGPDGYAVAPLNVGVLYIFMISSLTVYGVVLGGWASNSKYSLLGGLRSSAQMVSYELGLGLAVLSVVMVAGSLDLRVIVEQQGLGDTGSVLDWNVANPALWIAWVVFTICAYAELNRVPFDLPEAESELVAGFHTEYSSTKFALFFMAEYAGLMTMSALVVTLFFGGWRGLGIFDISGWPRWYQAVAPILIFFTKQFLFMLGAIWVRGTLPRMRYDQLMNFGWKVLVPAAGVSLVLVALTQASALGWF
jgi:NADH-quinone oxidoreductase subunit H